jgi:hypothetical protein
MVQMIENPVVEDGNILTREKYLKSVGKTISRNPGSRDDGF